MAYETAKQLLEHAGSFRQRTEAVRAALSLGMRLDEIETYLDWLDAIRPGPPPDDPGNDLPPSDSEKSSPPKT
jgi:hypothetical protein